MIIISVEKEGEIQWKRDYFWTKEASHILILKSVINIFFILEHLILYWSSAFSQLNTKYFFLNKHGRCHFILLKLILILVNFMAQSRLLFAYGSNWKTALAFLHWPYIQWDGLLLASTLMVSEEHIKLMRTSKVSQN